jgi:hypothetical protein
MMWEIEKGIVAEASEKKVKKILQKLTRRNISATWVEANHTGKLAMIH